MEFWLRPKHVGRKKITTEPETHPAGLHSAHALLRESLAEAQATVRGYDTKAQIVGVGYIFALGIVTQVEGLLPETGEFGLIGLLTAWVIVILPILIFGYVLYPTRKSAPRVEASKRDGIRNILYVDPSQLRTVGELREAAFDADPINELAFELLVVSALRDIKRRRFLLGLFTAAFSFIFLFASQLDRLV